ncbi:helix-turn-helix domain-containing protein [Fodinicola acaciae]|uniref:helix-turn-helix domain-containing protein n=1 Tax=Fodinicola acaciae TaxID=2681555 RepID=UPI0013CF9338|nr:helix-turn-helix transcriptional regulator [Fodinicola acaciae]
MTGQGKPTVRSRQVSSELRRLRKARGLTTGEVGARLGVSQSKISRIENCQLGLQLEEVAAMLGLYHVPIDRRDEILGLVREAAKPGWVEAHGEGLSEQWKALIDYERSATRLRNYEPLVVPGLLQTPEYARAIIHATAVCKRTDSEIESRVAARLGRQAILSRPLPPELHALVYEAALLTQVGGADVLAAQLRHLLVMAGKRQITIQVVPISAGPHPGLESPFMIMDSDAYETLVYLENKVLSIFLEETAHIETYRLAWKTILAKALSPERSAELIARAAANMARHSEEQR